MLCYIPEQQRPLLHCGGSLNSCATNVLSWEVTAHCMRFTKYFQYALHTVQFFVVYVTTLSATPDDTVSND